MNELLLSPSSDFWNLRERDLPHRLDLLTRNLHLISKHHRPLPAHLNLLRDTLNRTHQSLSEETLVVVYLGGMLFHNLLSILHSIRAMDSRPFRLNLLFLRMLVRKQFFDRALPRSCLIDSKTRCELDMRSDLYSIQHSNCVIL